MAHIKVSNPLRNWGALNEHLAVVTDASVLEELLEAEKEGKKRRNFLVRIHQRLTTVRMREERALLERFMGGKKGKRK